MTQSQVSGGLRLDHHVKVTKIDKATGLVVGEKRVSSKLEIPNPLAMFNAARAAQGLPPIGESDALRMIEQEGK